MDSRVLVKNLTSVQITTDDLLQAAQIEERGMLDRKERSPETWKQVAINEAATAVVAVNFPDLRNIEFVWPFNLCIKVVSCICTLFIFELVFAHHIYTCLEIREILKQNFIELNIYVSLKHFFF